jgi:hypothetical protein
MNTQAIGGCGGLGTSGGVSDVNRPDPTATKERMTKAMQPAAELLGMSNDDLKAALEQGQSLSDIATAKGVSRDDLLAVIKAGLKNNAPEGAPELSETQLDNLASRIADRSHTGGRRPSGPPEGSTTTSSTDVQMLLLQLLSKSDESQDSAAAQSGFSGLL